MYNAISNQYLVTKEQYLPFGWKCDNEKVSMINIMLFLLRILHNNYIKS